MIIVANFKANKNNNEVTSWLEKFNQLQNFFSGNIEKEVVVCPSLTALSDAFKKIKSLNWKIKISLGSQNVSAFDGGSYTGEVTIAMIKDYVKYVIIGHSERRKYFNESNESVTKKVILTKKAGLIPIVCVSKIEEVKGLTDFSGFLAFEPLFAIGSGNAANNKQIDVFIKEVKAVLKEVKVIYGGSVTPFNIQQFAKNINLYGVLVGDASLDPVVFANIVSHASQN